MGSDARARERSFYSSNSPKAAQGPNLAPGIVCLWGSLPASPGPGNGDSICELLHPQSVAHACCLEHSVDQGGIYFPLNFHLVTIQRLSPFFSLLSTRFVLKLQLGNSASPKSHHLPRPLRNITFYGIRQIRQCVRLFI